jgi:small subunit ribosomal protein S27e
VKMTRTRFLRVECSDCGNQQIIFGYPSTVVKCLACNKTIAKPTGGKGKIMVKIIKVE